jgi:hypothetical protein
MDDYYKDRKKDIMRLLVPQCSLETKAVIETFVSGVPPNQRPRIASNILTDIAALTLWGYLEREGPVEEEVLLVTEKAHKEPFDSYDTAPYQYSKERVDAFVAKLCGPLEPSTNDESLMVHARGSNALQFVYCMLESHCSIAKSEVTELIEEFNGLSFWEQANVMYALEDVLSRRIKHAGKYWANMARYVEGSEKREKPKKPVPVRKDDGLCLSCSKPVGASNTGYCQECNLEALKDM